MSNFHELNEVMEKYKTKFGHYEVLYKKINTKQKYTPYNTPHYPQEMWNKRIVVNCPDTPQWKELIEDLRS